MRSAGYSAYRSLRVLPSLIKRKGARGFDDEGFIDWADVYPFPYPVDRADYAGPVGPAVPFANAGPDRSSCRLGSVCFRVVFSCRSWRTPSMWLEGVKAENCFGILLRFPGRV